MIKSDEVTNPESCLNRAKDNEPLFCLLGRDPCAPDTIEYWIRQRIAEGKNAATDPQLTEAQDLANAMRAFRINNKHR